MRKLALALSFAAGAAFLGSAPALAADTDSVPGLSTESVSAAASYRCSGRLVNPSRWEGWCTVYSGQIRTITYCSNGRSSVGDWIGARPQPWFVYGNCPGSRVTRVQYQSRG